MSLGTPVPAAALSPEDFIRIGTEIQRRIGVKTSRNEPLGRFTTRRVGGPADLFAEVHNLFELRAIARFARAREIPLFVLVPATRDIHVGPIPLPWLAVGVLIYPVVFLAARIYVYQAERIEREFSDLMRQR